MKTLIFRNSTIEYLFFKSEDIVFSDYDSISFSENDYEQFFWFYNLPIIEDNNILVNLINDYQVRIKLLSRKISIDKIFIIFTLNSVGIVRFEHNNCKLKDAIYKINQFIYNLEKSNSNIKVIDFGLFLNKFPENLLIDWRYYFLSKSIINPSLANEFKNWFIYQWNAINQIRKKCLVLDLDNTLWGGILGEDGINGIKLNDNYPGNAFKQFQKCILELKKIGIILAISSKNNMHDVDELWEKNDQMILKKNDFVCLKINWVDKVKNIFEISKELNIGLDSIVFFDDNPTEREFVRSSLPDVIVPDFPTKPYKLIEFLHEIYLKHFNTYNITEEDKNKTKQYIENISRNNYKNLFNSIDSYIKGLKICISILQADEIYYTRFAQLSQKTNQFNLTTKRYTELDICRFVKSGHLVIGIKVRDKFGDSGVTGLAIVIFENKEECFIDTFLLSCRILGKGIENAFLSNILINLKERGYNKVYSEFLKSSKNQQVFDFYETQNFKIISIEKEKKLYQFDLQKNKINKIEKYIKIN